MSDSLHIYKQIIETGRDGITINTGRTFVYVNDSFAKMIGYSVNELIGMDIFQVTASEYWENIEEKTKRRQTGENVEPQYELELVRKDGSHFPVEFSVSIIDYEGKSSSLTIVRDISARKQSEEALQRSDERYQTLWEQSSDGLVIVDWESGGILECNEVFIRLTGRTIEELLLLKIWDIRPKSLVEAARKKFREMREVGLGGSSELQLLKPFGVLVDVELKSKLLVIDGKKVLVNIYRNISKRKQAEKALVASEERYRGLIEDSPVAISVTVGGEIVYVSPERLKLTGHASMDELLGASGLELVVSEDKERIRERTNARIQSESVSSITRFKMRTVDGGVIHVVDYMSNILWEGEAAVMHVLQDITKQVRYETLLEALNEHVSQLATQNTVQEVVSVTFSIIEDLFGYNYGSFGLVEGNTLHHIIVSKVEEIDDFYQSLDEAGVCSRAVRTGATQVVNETRNDPDFIIAVAEGIYEPRSELVVPILMEGVVGAVLNVESLVPGAFSVDDVRLVELLANHVGSAMNRIIETQKRLNSEQELFRERVQREHEQKMSMLKTRFIGDATHELRTPLTIMKGYLDLALSEELPPKIREYLIVASRNTDRLESLTNDLLDQQKIEEGQIELYMKQVNLNRLVASVVGEMTKLIEGRGQRVQVEALDESVTVFGDQVMLTRVLVNLLSNASKYSPEGAVVFVMIDKQGDVGLVSVRDEGFGLSEEDIGRLFHPFPGIDRPIVTAQSVGLGLSICRGLVELHGGTIWAESEGLGKGSIFSFTIPVSK